ncbi:pentatricopeptide repeat-containing protein At5g04780, mitochondrial-like [Aristolochia californica]|uniref:pentatricopeptide repeat-containing protein At5g04780, mitochondrial-like n=1 Tax=Aristolochia californica TaxID=171875 RepID=UPI0035D75409
MRAPFVKPSSLCASPWFAVARSLHNGSITPTRLNHLLNNATQIKSVNHADQIHAQIIFHGYTSFPFLLNNLINTYSKCGLSNHSLVVFSMAPHKNIITWTSLITHFSQTHQPHRAFSLFSLMRSAGLQPNHFTVSAVLPACAETEVVVYGEQVHGIVWKYGHLLDVFVGSALVDMYAKCANVAAATRVFDEMLERNLVSWNAMIVGLTQNKFYEEAMRIFHRLVNVDSFSPDQVSFSSVLSASGNVGDLNFGKQVHALAFKLGLKTLAYVKNSLMDMYSKCGCFEDVMRLFHTITDRDVVTWNVMIMGWVLRDCFEEACNGFWLMRREEILPDEASFSTALHASANLAALDQGASIHDQIIKAGFVTNICVGSSLITMYAKCGTLDDATRVFYEIKDQNVVTWTAIIAACQQHGCGARVIKHFEEMLKANVKPDYITFVCVLAACSHNGLVEEGCQYFNSMSQVHGMNPGSEHYACMVDLLGRAGKLDEAKSFIKSMPIKPDPSVWGALLGACRTYGNLQMGEEVAQKLFKMEPENSGNYVLLCNLYTCHGMLKEANEIRRSMGLNKVRKETGCSWIDIKNKTFVFTVHDKSHSNTKEIYEMLGKIEEMVKNKGYVAETEYAVNDIGEYKEQSLWYHSEKLALAFGLITLPTGAPIRIKKNLRTCGDCHTVMKLASEIFDRQIVVRDINRFHHFTNGLCSCGDYW